VPLSEDEERILQEIAQQFYADDPHLARAVGNTTLYTHSVRRLKWSTALFVVGLIVLVLTISTWYLSFAGFLVMLASALMFERNARKLGKVGLDQVTKSVRASGVRDFFGSTGQRMRDRFRRDDQ
jgi:hypothetical protein